MASWTFQSLFASAATVSESRRNPPASKSVRLYNVVPYQQQNCLLLQFEHYGLTSLAQYQANMFWTGVKVSVAEEEDTSDHVKILYKGKTVWTQKPSLSRSGLLVRCTCPDFYFTFAWWNMERAALFGPRPRRYTPKSNRPSRNPSHAPGLCKHLINSARELSQRQAVLP